MAGRAELDERVEPFRVEVADEVLEDLEARLERTRFPTQIPGSGWDYGTDLSYLEELCRYWREGYDWRSQEAMLNSFEQYCTVVDGQRIHFLHVRSPHEGAVPLMVVHGWPGSVVEFYKVIGPLTDPPAHGGDARDAFHVVCPSLPGYAWSGPTTERGWDSRRIAAAFGELMSRIGYERFGAQGGDWGSMVNCQLAHLAPERLVGLHLNMVIAGPPEGDDLSGLTEAESKGLADMAEYDKEDSGYAKVQGTKPQTVGYGLNDSPAGLAAWIVEKFRTWSDCDGDVEKAFTKDELLTNIMLYWVTQTASTSARLYYETMHSGRYGLMGERIEVPTGCAIFPREIVRPPRRWVEAQYNLVHWSELPAGGHFAAFEQPELFVEDVRSMFRKLR